MPFLFPSRNSELHSQRSQPFPSLTNTSQIHTTFAFQSQLLQITAKIRTPIHTLELNFVSKMKRKAQPVNFAKKLRFKFPRSRRSQISPVLCSDVKKNFVTDLPADSTASSKLTREVSLDSSIVSVNNSKPSLKRNGFEEFAGFPKLEVPRRITRYYLRKFKRAKEEEETKGVCDAEVEASESSCVESCSVVDSLDSNLKRFGNKGAGNADKFKGIEESEATTEFEVSCAKPFPAKITKSGGERGAAESAVQFKEDETVQFSGKLETGTENKVSRVELSEFSREFAESNCEVANSESTIDQKSLINANDSDLACSERICYEDLSEYSSAFSELQSELFHDSSDLDLSDGSSIWSDSGSEFSECSSSDKSPSPTFTLLIQYRQQFSRSSCSPDFRISSCVEDEFADAIPALKFEDDEDEISYQCFRRRERSTVFIHDYAEEYCSMTRYGELIIQQRLQMVHWMIEQSTARELQKETVFLAVSLLDRLLSKGFFQEKRQLQVLGIACLTLATRIEENQPYNNVRQKVFQISTSTYSRSEVVAMEWLVEEVLNFQCFLPTIYNFLWFYLKVAGANEEVEKTTKYLAMLALLGHEQLCYWPSTVAAALVVLASLASHQEEFCDLVMQTHLRTTEDDLPGCIKSLEWLVNYAC